MYSPFGNVTWWVKPCINNSTLIVLTVHEQMVSLLPTCRGYRQARNRKDELHCLPCDVHIPIPTFICLAYNSLAYVIKSDVAVIISVLWQSLLSLVGFNWHFFAICPGFPVRWKVLVFRLLLLFSEPLNFCRQSFAMWLFLEHVKNFLASLLELISFCWVLSSLSMRFETVFSLL